MYLSPATCSFGVPQGLALYSPAQVAPAAREHFLRLTLIHISLRLSSPLDVRDDLRRSLEVERYSHGCFFIGSWRLYRDIKQLSRGLYVRVYKVCEWLLKQVISPERVIYIHTRAPLPSISGEELTIRVASSGTLAATARTSAGILSNAST
jgi:hypothetical protein